jgi:ribosomal protein S18 acetylase RimI-like enzyme
MTDEPHLTRLSHAYAQEHSAELLSFTADQGWDSWTADNLLADRPRKWELSLVLTNDLGPCGYAIISEAAPDLHHLHHFAIAPPFRGKGLGSLAVSRALQQAAREQCSLRLKVHKTNTAAFRFYQRLGFAVMDESDEYITLLKETAG